MQKNKIKFINIFIWLIKKTIYFFEETKMNYITTTKVFLVQEMQGRNTKVRTKNIQYLQGNPCTTKP